jgi:glycosyltransferase involved in cell wall biosynthesis
VLASDNASTDGTGNILRQWAKRIPLKIIRQPTTIPMTDHFNYLLNRVETEYYMVLSHDDYFYSPEAIAKSLAVLQAHKDVSAVYCDLVYVSERRRALARRRFGRSGKLVGDAVGRQSLMKVRNMFGIPVLIRHDALGSNRYDDKFSYVPDVDLSWQISKMAPAWHIPEVLVANRFHGGNSTWGWLAGAENEYLQLAQKHGVRLSLGERMQIKVTCWGVAQQKRLFGNYERLVTRFESH